MGWAVYGRNDKLARHWMIQHSQHQADYFRILQYTRLSAITTSWFTTLRGVNATPAERRNAMLLGAMTPLYDDLMDREGMTHNEILTSKKRTNFSQESVRSILYELKKNAPDKALFEWVLHQSGNAQNRSLLQIQSTPPPTEELIDITAEKGAAFTLIYRVILDHPLSPKEEEAITTLGFLLQMTNDLFDVHKDLQTGQHTLLTRENNLDLVQMMWNDKLLLFQEQWLGLSFSQTAIIQSMYEIGILFGRGQVALDRLIQLTTTTQGHYLPQTYTRHQLICDMEHPMNFWRSLSWANTWCRINT